MQLCLKSHAYLPASVPMPRQRSLQHAITAHISSQVSFQPRLSIISGSLAYFVPDFLHFMIVLVTAIVMLASICNIIYGYRWGKGLHACRVCCLPFTPCFLPDDEYTTQAPQYTQPACQPCTSSHAQHPKTPSLAPHRVENVSSASEAVSTLLQYMFTGVNTIDAGSFSLSGILPREVELHAAELALAEIIVLAFPIFFINVLYYLIVAMLLIPLWHLRRANKHLPGVLKDMLNRWGPCRACARHGIACAWGLRVLLMAVDPPKCFNLEPTCLRAAFDCCRLRWNYQVKWEAAPTNKKLDEQFDWLLLPHMQHSWW